MKTQLNAVRALMACDNWWTLESLKEAVRRGGVGISETAVSARIRDLRKKKYGGYTVLTRKTGRKGIVEYKLVLPVDTAMSHATLER